MSEFFWPVRVYYEDTDSGGVVYYANYLKFMERARTEWLRNAGLQQDRLRDEHGIVFAVRDIKIDFFAAARFNDALQVTATILEQKKASLIFHQIIVREQEPDDILCAGHVRIACVMADTFKPAPIPEFVLEILNVD